MSEGTNALVQAMTDLEGLPPVGVVEMARRTIKQLDRLGFEIRRKPPAGLKITGYPCTCSSNRGCMEHPFRLPGECVVTGDGQCQTHVSSCPD